MAFNRKAKLRDNIEAIRTVFELDKTKRQASTEEKEVLSRYCGFGGLKCILNPATDLSDTALWAKSDLELFPMTAELHRVIRSNSINETEYKRYVDSLKSSVLTAFYTPAEIVSVLTDTLQEHGITPQKLLDPSAGQGAFISAFTQHAPSAEVMAFEKDLLTGKLLSYLYPEYKIRTEGFEKIEQPFNGYFDVVSSNIPFGDIAVFDPAFSSSKDNARRQSAKTIHNYFFVKGLDTVREGGIVAFITSQGVMNAPQYEAQRKLLIENTDLVSAIRLPNNLFTEIANTEVGSDLIVLQKHSGKGQISSAEQAFLKGYDTPSGTTTNQYFQNEQRIVHTKHFLDTDPYGKPSMIYLHEGGIQGMATDLKGMLSEDFAERLDRSLYQEFATQSSATENFHPIQTDKSKSLFEATENKVITTQQTITENPTAGNTPKIEPPVMSLYDLFGLTEHERRQMQTGSVKSNSTHKKKQVALSQRNLFNQAATFREQVAPGSETAKEAKQIDIYSTIDYDNNPPINGFYEMMMRLSPELRIQLRKENTISLHPKTETERPISNSFKEGQKKIWEPNKEEALPKKKQRTSCPGFFHRHWNRTTGKDRWYWKITFRLVT